MEQVCMCRGETGVQLGMEEPVPFLLAPHLQTEVLRPDNGESWWSGEMEASEGQVLMVMWTGRVWRMPPVLSLKNHESECCTSLSKYTLRSSFLINIMLHVYGLF